MIPFVVFFLFSQSSLLSFLLLHLNWPLVSSQTIERNLHTSSPCIIFYWVYILLIFIPFSLQVLAPIVSFLLPTFQFSAANKKGLPVSRDPEALLAKYSDPLVYTGSIRVRTGYEILRISTYLQQNLRKLRVPFFVLHGTADTVTDPEASQKLYEEASSTDKSIKLYEGLLHDLLFEPEKDDVLHDILQWLNSRVRS